jgi:hypothetical protein
MSSRHWDVEELKQTYDLKVFGSRLLLEQNHDQLVDFFNGLVYLVLTEMGQRR